MTKIIVALDYSNEKTFEEKVKELAPSGVMFKVGLEAINAIGHKKAIKIIKENGGQVFYDGKFNDIPNTMSKAIAIVAKMGVKSISVHAASGEESILAAVANKGEAEIWLVTVLTSIGDDEAKRLFGKEAIGKVMEFVDIGKRIGVDGIVCSANEAKLIKERYPGLKLITPGVRPEWASKNDQKRTMTPKEAADLGIDYLVIGRPITNPPGSMTSEQSITKILDEIKSSGCFENK